MLVSEIKPDFFNRVYSPAIGAIAVRFTIKTQAGRYLDFVCTQYSGISLAVCLGTGEAYTRLQLISSWGDCTILNVLR